MYPPVPETFTIDTEEGPIKHNLTPLPIYDYRNPLLSYTPIPFDFSSKPAAFDEILDRMFMTLKHFNGLGLAATQVGIRSCFFVLTPDIVCFNPKIISFGTEEKREKEWCLSYPGLQLPITRPTSVQVEYYDREGKKQEREFQGMTARCFQHEYDHLQGIVFTQKVSKMTLEMYKKKQHKLLKRIKRIQLAQGQRRN